MRFVPLAATLGVAAVLGVVPAQADPGGTDQPDVGNGSISATIEKFGQSICPSLVKPGSSLASTLSELQGNTGLTPTLTGMVAGFVIQTQCPAVMTQISKGDLSALNLKLPGTDDPPTGLDLSALLNSPKPEQKPSGLDLSQLLNSPAPEPKPSGLDLSQLLNPNGR